MAGTGRGTRAVGLAAIAVAAVAALEFSPLQPFGLRAEFLSSAGAQGDGLTAPAEPTSSTVGPLATADSGTAPSPDTITFPDRTADDRDAPTGGAAVAGGGDWEVSVGTAAVETDPGGQDQLVVPVTVTNRGPEARLYQAFYWELRDPKGQRHLILPIGRPGTVPFKTLSPGEELAAVVVFGVGHGNHVVLFEAPGSPGGGRLVWQVEA